MPTANTITASTPTPFTIVRNLWTEHPDTLEDMLLVGVRITVEDACFDADTVEEEGFSGDWCVHLSDDPRFADLPEEAKEIACDACSNLLEDLACRLARGEAVPVESDEAFDV
jgi:hypothetical protein